MAHQATKAPSLPDLVTNLCQESVKLLALVFSYQPDKRCSHMTELVGHLRPDDTELYTGTPPSTTNSPADHSLATVLRSASILNLTIKLALSGLLISRCQTMGSIPSPATLFSSALWSSHLDIQLGQLHANLHSGNEFLGGIVPAIGGLGSTSSCIALIFHGLEVTKFDCWFQSSAKVHYIGGPGPTQFCSLEVTLLSINQLLKGFNEYDTENTRFHLS
ncbi:hypothetical protein PM082_006545 [Marasmius tenuissimus]|nr:hypothetical protein PM082_006545 [Marasmius tenuissimus]